MTTAIENLVIFPEVLSARHRTNHLIPWKTPTSGRRTRSVNGYEKINNRNNSYRPHYHSTQWISYQAMFVIKIIIYCWTTQTFLYSIETLLPMISKSLTSARRRENCRSNSLSQEFNCSFFSRYFLFESIDIPFSFIPEWPVIVPPPGTMKVPHHYCVFYVATAGLQGNLLGSDEQEIILLIYVIIDSYVNKVSCFKFNFLFFIQFFFTLLFWS